MKLIYLFLVFILISLSTNAQPINQYDKDSLKHGLWVKVDTNTCDYEYIPQYVQDPNVSYNVIDTVFWFRCPSPCYSVIVQKENYTHGTLDGNAFQSRIEYCSDTSCDCDIHISGIVLSRAEYEKYSTYYKGNLISETYYSLDIDTNIKDLKYRYYYKNEDTAVYVRYNNNQLEYRYFLEPSKVTPYKWGDARLEVYSLNAGYYRIEYFDSLNKIVRTVISSDTSIFVQEIRNDSSYYFSLEYLTSRLTYPDLYDETSSDNNIDYNDYPLFNEYEVSQITQKLAAIINVNTFIDINDTFISISGLDYSEVQIVDSLLPYSYHFIEVNEELPDDNSDSEYGDDYSYSNEDKNLSDHIDEYCGLKNQHLIKKGDSTINAKDFIIEGTKRAEKQTIVSRIYTYVDLDSLKWMQVDITKDTVYMPEGSFDNILFSEIITYDKKGKVDRAVKVKKENDKYFRVTYNRRGRLTSKEEIVIIALPTLKLFEIYGSNYLEVLYIELKRQP